MLEKLVEKTSVADVVVIIIGSLALVSFWRGVWGLMDLYVFPHDPAFSFTVSTAVGILILFGIASYRRRRGR